MSFYRGEDWESFERSPEFSRLANNLDGAEVTIIRVPRPGARVDGAAVDDFWVRYLDAQGAATVHPSARRLLRGRHPLSPDVPRPPRQGGARRRVPRRRGRLLGDQVSRFGPFWAVGWTVGRCFSTSRPWCSRAAAHRAGGDRRQLLLSRLPPHPGLALGDALPADAERGAGRAHALDHLRLRDRAGLHDPRHPAAGDLHPAAARHRRAGPRNPDRTAAGGARAPPGARRERRHNQGNSRPRRSSSPPSRRRGSPRRRPTSGRAQRAGCSRRRGLHRDAGRTLDEPARSGEEIGDSVARAPTAAQAAIRSRSRK